MKKFYLGTAIGITYRSNSYNLQFTYMHSYLLIPVAEQFHKKKKKQTHRPSTSKLSETLLNI